jgi:hypothetical protein
MYLVQTIGALGDVGAPPVQQTPTIDGRPLVAVAVGGVLLGALGFWAWGHFGTKRARR